MAHGVDSNKKECCKEGAKDETVLVKATDLPRHGNPYPPKDFVATDKPSMLESKITSLRSTIQPYAAPIGTAYGRVSDFAATGLAHSSSMFQRLSDSQNSIIHALLISGAGLLGAAVARRRRILTGAIFATGAIAACYPNEATEKAQLTWYIVKNKLPDFAREQYGKLVKANKETDKVKEVQTTELKTNQSS